MNSKEHNVSKNWAVYGILYVLVLPKHYLNIMNYDQPMEF